MDELWGRCPKCGEWFVIDDPNLDTLYLCPRHLLPAAVTRWHGPADEGLVVQRQSRHSTSA